jgi:hypothetical protein
MIRFIKNIGEYFASNYFDEEFASKVLAKTGYASNDLKEFDKRISDLKEKYYRYKQLYIEGKLRIKDRIFETHQFHSLLLKALGYDAEHTNYGQLFHLSETDVIPVRHILHRGDQPFLMIMEMQSMVREDEQEPDGLFEQSYNTEDDSAASSAQRYHRSQWDRVFTVPDGLSISPVIINKAVSELFLLEPHQRPKFILLLAGNTVFLLEQEKWFRGSYLQFDLEDLFTEATAARSANYYPLFYFLTAKEALAPDSNLVLLEQLDEDSHKSAYEVTKDLKEGIIYAVEALANEALYYKKQVLLQVFDETDDTFEAQMKDDCLRLIYRLLFIFYAESREDLDILPTDDLIYERGYSLEMLRELEQVVLHSEGSRNGYFFHDSLDRLFRLLSGGYREKESGDNRSFRVRHIDSPFFDDRKLLHLQRVKFRNKVWQEIICRLSLSKQQRNRTRGRISYANLGINQLGSVYESLLAYRGFYAEQDYIEVHKKGKPQEGTYLVPRSRRDDFEEDEILKTDKGEDVILKKGEFVYRLSGRDRQKSASYYTPEVLTQSTVKYTLKPMLEKLDRGEMKAVELLDLKLLEPAMGAAAFQNEMVNQLAEAYLTYRQKELREQGRTQWKVEPDKYREELQKVKAYIATNNVYGVDLNPTAIELGKLSLWLNVIHKDMETPFFSNRICTGNAVVGAWLKVYDADDICAEAVSGKKRKAKADAGSKEWWEKAPRHLQFKPTTEYDRIRTDRKSSEIYHFLLPDKNMVPSSGIKLLKEEYPAEVKAVANWRKTFTAPLNQEEYLKVQALSAKIDELLAEYYRFQLSVQASTASRQQIFGSTRKSEQATMDLPSYDEKEKLADQRNRHNAPYFKLKLVMDYWCSLWFWDVRQAGELPTRQQYWNDLAVILELDTEKAISREAFAEMPLPAKKPVSEIQLSLLVEEEPAAGNQFQEAVVKYANRQDLFDDNRRLKTVTALAERYRFFHPQLEFLEVLWERGGFDLIAGNPPWVSVEMDESGLLSERNPEVLLRDFTAPKIKQVLYNDMRADYMLKNAFVEEFIWASSTKAFLGGNQNYTLLNGQRNNVYKCVLVNAISMVNTEGLIGLIHPSGIYEDPSAGRLREELYQRLIYNFQFTNVLKLFSEILMWISFDINVYKGSIDVIDFISISKLYHPSTIDGSLIHDGFGVSKGLKYKDELSGDYKWNILPHKSRVVRIREKELNVIAKFNNDHEFYKSTKLITPFTSELINVFEKLSKFGKEIKSKECKVTMCWNQTNSVNDGTLLEETRYVNIDKYEFVYSGPHFYVSNPLSKNPHSDYSNQFDYDVIDLNMIDDKFTQRCNYVPAISSLELIEKAGAFDRKNWVEFYKLGISKMVNTATERTLQPAILIPKSSHIDGVISIVFKEDKDLLEMTALMSSIIYDYQIKAQGKSNIYDDTISSFRIGVNDVFKDHLFSRVLLLNCVNSFYSNLWSEMWRDSYKRLSWSRYDFRLKSLDNLDSNWKWEWPLRNWFERRQALLEIDVIAAMSLGFSLEELILIYYVQFPVLQQNEDDTWYDQKGNIVFTCSKGLNGVGVDRPVWETIRHLTAGETYEHTITKSELYQGKKVIYHAPFDKCDRVEDYKIAWAHFEKVFNKPN